MHRRLRRDRRCRQTSCRKQVVACDGDLADEAGRPEIRDDVAVERGADALEYDLTESLVRRLGDWWAALLPPDDPGAVLRLKLPADRHGARGRRKRPMLGRVGGKL